VHILGAILCLATAAALISVLLAEYGDLPGWATAMGVVTIGVLVASAMRIYRNGRERIHRNEGPRTRIVLSGPSDPVPSERSNGPGEDA